MAKANSHTLSNIRGSVGGLTYTANQFQTIVMRTRAAPTNPKTDFQTEVRSAFSGAETLWKGLSGSQRAQWNDYADTLTFTGPLGTYKLPGRQVFMGIFTCATYWKQRGGAIGALDPTPPVIPGFLDIDNVHTSSFTAPGATGVALQFEYSGAEDIETYCIRSIGYNGSRM
ncbi:MAG: hypothetical protein MJA29_07620, partial [Candidatus Omnitrophica bacterium]|nr:hypothetical protein [Candidatus Omnitrophota bacterium]